MLDPLERLTSDGLIRTGARHDRLAEPFVPVVDAAVELLGTADVTIYVYGSVATGQARQPTSDVDLLTIGSEAERAGEIASRLSTQFADVCRSVEIGAAMPSDFAGDGDEAYGNRVFLHHYCVHLGGPDLDRATAGFPGDRRAARGFNGDIARHADRWHEDLGATEPAVLGRRVARKTLLAVAGLVSIHDTTWTTDRGTAARRWSQLRPGLAGGLTTLLDWSADRSVADRATLAHHLDATVGPLVSQFADTIGLWP